MSLSLKDARVLRGYLLDNDNRDDACNVYADEHDRYYAAIHDFELWQTKLLLETGPDADVGRQKAFAEWQEDRPRRLDVLMS